MGFWNDDSAQQSYSDSYDTVQKSTDHQSSITHEILAGAASYEAAKAWENHEAQNGEPPSHEKAKEILAAVTGAFVDREFETKGLDWIDKEKAKKDAYNQAYDQVSPQY